MRTNTCPRALASIMVFCALAMAAGTEIVQAASSREAIDQYGQIHKWSVEPGAVTIVDFAAAWCGPCRETLPRLQDFAAEHPEVRILVISVDEAASGRDALVRDLGLEVPVLWDEDHRAAEFYRPEGMPTTFLFDWEGKEILNVVGSKEKDWHQLTAAVSEALAAVDHRELEVRSRSEN